MTDNKDNIRVDLGNPQVPPFEMMLEIKLPLVMKPDVIQELMSKAAELRAWFMETHGSSTD